MNIDIDYENNEKLAEDVRIFIKLFSKDADTEQCLKRIINLAYKYGYIDGSLDAIDVIAKENGVVLK